MRRVLDINNNWYYKAPFNSGEASLDKMIQDSEKVNLPHTNVELTYNYFDEKTYQIEACYQYPLTISKEYNGKAIFVHFEGVMNYSKVYLNGEFLAEHKGGYTPFEVRIDRNYDFELENNILSVIVDSRELENIPPFGGQIDYLTYGGIYREVSLGIYDNIFIKNIKVETNMVLELEKEIELKLFLENLKQITGTAELNVTIEEKTGLEIYSNVFKVDIQEGKKEYKLLISNLKNVRLWDIEQPNLYKIIVKMSIDGNSDEYNEIFGFRKVEFTPNGFYLNNKKIKIVGLNRHQSYPYVGYAMPKRVQEKDAEVLKNDLHLNLVRTSHYPQSKHFLNKCDELGLLVFEEIPGWQHIGNEEWKSVAKDNVREMVERDWNHPSIIIWGVRINESPDDDIFYADTNKIAHELDSTRQTGGVRCITDSNLLEDVYTFNDFVHDGIELPLRGQQEVTGLNLKVPYLITEYNGHMYPTKRFDQEERQVEHSMRHLKVQNASFLDDAISGAIGWCAFDYNTHKDFGSGDRICYHGVMDMFRIHKFASYVYKSQVSPEVEVVLEPITFWARGERSIGGIIPLVIFTNCEYIDFKYGNFKEKRIYPRVEEYKGMPYPPIIIDYTVITPEEAGSWGMEWEDAEIKGYYKDELLIQRKLSKAPIPSELYVEADDLILSAAQKDATRFVVKILDEHGNLLPFIDEIIKIEVIGPGKLQGPKEVVLKGGAIGFWIETINEPGNIEVIVTSQSLGAKTINLAVI